MPGLQRIPKETIMAAIAKLGPSQPIDVRKELKQGDTFLIGAMLSELVADGSLQISKVRRGGGPFYFDPTTPERLEQISQYLNEKDRRTYAMLKEQKVMREDAQDPLVRVGLKNMPDFSKQIVVDDVVYWRYFLVDEDEARRVVRGEAANVTPKVIEKVEMQQQLEAPEVAQKEPKPIEEKLKKSRAKTKASDAKPKRTRTKKTPEPVMMPDGAVMVSPEEWLAHDTLYSRVETFANGMKIRDARVHKPHAELTCIVTLETPFGAIDTFVYAFNKKFTPDDIKENMQRARELGLPIIILSVDSIPGKVTTSFKGMPNIIFKKFE